MTSEREGEREREGGREREREREMGGREKERKIGHCVSGCVHSHLNVASPRSHFCLKVSVSRSVFKIASFTMDALRVREENMCIR